jgi:hypothetical protein
MFWYKGGSLLGTKVSGDGSFKDFHHEAKEGPRQSSIPTTFGMFVAYEGMLSLHLQELYKLTEVSFFGKE